MPTSAPQLLIFLLFVVPGFVYQGVRISVRGRLQPDVNLATRIVNAIVTSGVFALVYLAVLGQHLVNAAHQRGYGFEHPRAGAILAFAGGILVPAVAALIRLPEWTWLASIRARLPQVTKYDPTPTAWDKVFQNVGECFIRVLNSQGRWIAGYYGPESYATSYPDPHQLFLERAFQVSDDGSIGDEIDATQGVLIDCTGVQLIQVVTAIREPEEAPA